MPPTTSPMMATTLTSETTTLRRVLQRARPLRRLALEAD